MYATIVPWNTHTHTVVALSNENVGTIIFAQNPCQPLYHKVAHKQNLIEVAL